VHIVGLYNAMPKATVGTIENADCIDSR